jgi:tetratricopeptide (TPR) repeat protein
LDRCAICKWAVWMMVAGVIIACGQEGPAIPEQIIQKRPHTDGFIFDYVGLMTDVKESTRRYLETIYTRYGIEILIVALPSLENRYTVSDAAAILFTNWEIGKTCDGRGILLLFVEDQKRVKLEISYDLEDVFTDAFTGHIQDVQLQPRYIAGQLDVGFIAVMEALESRAQVKYGGNYTPRTVAALDLAYLSQGAGSEQNLEVYHRRLADRPSVANGTVNHNYPAGETPEAAWRTLIRRWQDRVKDPNLGVYTAVTRLAYRDFINRPDASLEKEYATYRSKQYTIRQSGDYAVVDFGKKKGWENAPFLLCHTVDGWQFDIVHQRRFVRMGKAPHWGVEFSEHPYMRLLMETFHFRGQDIPLEGDDRYTIEMDGEIARRIVAAESRVAEEPDNPDALLELGRLYTTTAMGAKAIPILQKVLSMNPDDASAHKYLAIAHTDAYYQYDAAFDHVDAYIRRVADDPFGYNFAGYLNYRKKAYSAAIEDFERVLVIHPNDCYAHFYLTYAYAWRYADAASLNPKKNFYQQRFRLHRDKTRSFAATHPIRVAWMNRWLDK